MSQVADLDVEETPDEAVVVQRPSRGRAVAIVAACAVVVVYSATQVGLDADRLTRIMPRLEFIGGRIWPPNIDEPQLLLEGVLDSLQIAVVGTVFGILLSAPLAPLAARNITPIAPVRAVVKGIAGFVRAVPALVWALLFIMAVGLGPTPGILALAVNSMGMLIKVYAETIEEVPDGPIEMLRSSGATRLQVAMQGILPCTIRSFIAWSVFRLDINVRYSAVLGIVGAGGIGWELVRAAAGSRYDDAFGIALVIFAMVMAAEWASQWLRSRVDADVEMVAGAAQA